MTQYLMGIAAALLLLLVIGLGRATIGPRATDQLLAAQLLATLGIAALLVLAFALDDPAVVDVALVLAALGLVAVVAFVRRAREASPPGARP